MNTKYIKSSRQVGIAFSASLSIYLRGLLLIPILTRALGTVGYGAWVQMFACTELLLGVAVLGLDSALVRFLPSRKSEGCLAEDISSILSIAGLVAVLATTHDRRGVAHRGPKQRFLVDGVAAPLPTWPPALPELPERGLPGQTETRRRTCSLAWPPVGTPRRHRHLAQLIAIKDEPRRCDRVPRPAHGPPSWGALGAAAMRTPRAP